MRLGMAGFYIDSRCFVVAEVRLCGYLLLNEAGNSRDLKRILIKMHAMKLVNLGWDWHGFSGDGLGLVGLM